MRPGPLLFHSRMLVSGLYLDQCTFLKRSDGTSPWKQRVKYRFNVEAKTFLLETLSAAPFADVSVVVQGDGAHHERHEMFGPGREGPIMQITYCTLFAFIIGHKKTSRE